MKKNMGSLDRGIRLAIVVALAALYLGGLINGWIVAAAAVVGLIFLLTSAVGSCPLYSVVGISTCSKTSEG